MVVARDSELPKVCVRWGEPGSQQISRKLSWASRWYLVLAVAALIFYIIAASIAAKRSRLTFWLCESHAAARRRDVRIGWMGLGLIVLSLLMLMYGGSVLPRSALAALPIVEMLLLLGGLAISLYGYFRSRIVRAAKIDDGHVWLKGVTPSIRDSLTPFSSGTG